MNNTQKKELQKFSDFDTQKLLQIINLLILIASPILTYKYIESVKIRNDENKIVLDQISVESDKERVKNDKERITIEKDKLSTDKLNAATATSNMLSNQSKVLIDISKFLSDLKPKISADCNASLILATKLKIVCSIKNEGVHTLGFKPPVASLKFIDSDNYIDNKYFRQTYSSGNVLPQGLAGTNTILLDIPTPLNWDKLEVTVKFDAITDENIVRIANQVLEVKEGDNLTNSLAQLSILYHLPVKQFQNFNYNQESRGK